MIYLDSSALVKLVLREDESLALSRWLNECGDAPNFTSDLALVEVPRAVMRFAPTALLRVRDVLDAVNMIQLKTPVLNSAASLQPPALRSLDAVHLASALQLGPDLTGFVAYDRRLHDAARDAGLPAVRPA